MVVSLAVTVCIIPLVVLCMVSVGRVGFFVVTFFTIASILSLHCFASTTRGHIYLKSNEKHIWLCTCRGDALFFGSHRGLCLLCLATTASGTDHGELLYIYATAKTAILYV